MYAYCASRCLTAYFAITSTNCTCMTSAPNLQTSSSSCDRALIYKHRTELTSNIHTKYVSAQVGIWTPLHSEEITLIPRLRTPAHVIIDSNTRPFYMYTDGNGYAVGSGVGMAGSGRVLLPKLTTDYSITTRNTVAPSNNTFMLPFS